MISPSHLSLGLLRWGFFPSSSLSLSFVWVINVNLDVVDWVMCVNVTTVNPT